MTVEGFSQGVEALDNKSKKKQAPKKDTTPRLERFFESSFWLFGVFRGKFE